MSAYICILSAQQVERHLKLLLMMIIYHKILNSTPQIFFRIVTAATIRRTISVAQNMIYCDLHVIFEQGFECLSTCGAESTIRHAFMYLNLLLLWKITCKQPNQNLKMGMYFVAQRYMYS